MICQICHKVIVPDILGLSPKVIEIYEEETFIVHSNCAVQFLNAYKKLDTEEERVQFVEAQLNKMSH